MKTALTTEELGLRPAIAPVGVAATVAPLRGVPRIDGDDLAGESLRLVLKKALELGEAPRVQSTFGFATPGLDPAADVGEVFDHDSGAWLNATQDRSRKHVVAIPSETLLASSEASKMPAGTLRAVGLQITPESEDAIGHFLPPTLAVKAVVGGDGGVSDAQVHADSLAVGTESNVGQSDYNVKVEPSLAVDKISRRRRTANRVVGIAGQRKAHLDPSTRRRQVDDAALPVQPERVKVVPGRAEHGLRTSRPESFPLSGHGGLQRFGGLLSGLNVQVGHEVRLGILATPVGQPMQRVGIALVLLPTDVADSIERLGELRHSLVKRFSLFGGGLEKYPNRPIHDHIVPYIRHNLQSLGKEVSADFSAS